MAQSPDVRASRVEATVPGLIERAIDGQSASKDVTALKADIVGLQKDVDKLKSTNLWMFFGIVTLPEVSSSDFLASSEILLSTTSRDMAMDETDVEFNAETDEEELGIRDASMYRDFEDLEGAMVQTAVAASLRDTSMVGSS
ncbi:uncharacterized protein LOC125873847 [Solanum stenotomum]|uniref:uncharacterized protein LOC125873847 n=1 Tax=Solanum stenotomum TaxID=172797 RepID=UPI0020CFF3C4|nr:uncharacterized protein LOC125873847 [Solanum stenotomum]